MSPLSSTLAAQANPVSMAWRTATPHRSRTPGKRRSPHAQFVLRALELFPGSAVLETFPHHNPTHDAPQP